jgi:hypothetical protein
MWTAAGNTWAHSALPYEICRTARLAELMPGGVLEHFEVRRNGELLAVRYCFSDAAQYAVERWELLDGRH